MVSFTAFMTFSEHVALLVNHKANSSEYQVDQLNCHLLVGLLQMDMFQM